ncbi:MAG: thiosulfohydrolase SoxB [Thiohalomonadales bacterium]
MQRREFLQAMSAAALAGIIPKNLLAQANFEYQYQLPSNGDLRILHFTDVHGQLLPVHFREPSVNLGIGSAKNKPPHLVGTHALRYYGLSPDSPEAHALTYLGFDEASRRYGKMGGFAHIASLVKRLRQDFGVDRTLLLDGGDTWQGSATALWTQGEDMVAACNELGVDAMTGHWEFTYPEQRIRENIKLFKGDFLAQNIFVKEEAQFEGAETFAEDSGLALRPYTIKSMAGIRIAIIGQAFPYTPVANPSRYIPNWSFGIREYELQATIDKVRDKEKAKLVILLSHNGMDVDLKLAKRVSGLDVILGGHTHDAVPQAVSITNAGGRTLVTNAGSSGKFVGVFDIKLSKNGISGYRYRLLPVFSNLIEADKSMSALIKKVRAPYEKKLTTPLAVAGELFYRRGNFNGSFDQLICDALLEEYDAEIALSPGFRWGTSVLAGDTITLEDVMAQTAITYPETYMREMSGKDIKAILEDVCDNLFNKDAYQQQGGDMVRTGGLEYACDPNASIGHRIKDLRLSSGRKLQANKNYKVTGWATVNSKATGRAVWDIVADYLKASKTARIAHLEQPRLLGINKNMGIEL